MENGTVFALKQDSDQKQRAQQKLRQAVARGEITRRPRCQHCETACQTHGHHFDYDKPLEVIWLCHPCHMTLHARINRQLKLDMHNAFRGLMGKESIDFAEYAKADVNSDSMMTRLRAERQRRGYNLNQCAELLGTDAGNLSRIEVGKQRPGPDMAHRLFDFYDGAVPLGAIYDPVFARERDVDGMNGHDVDSA